MLLIQTATLFTYYCASLIIIIIIIITSIIITIIIITMFCYCYFYWTYLSRVLSQHSQLPCLFCFVVVFIQF